VRIDATLTLSPSLSGVTSQGSIGGFKLPVTLTSTDVAAPDGCTASSGGGTGGGGTGSGGGGSDGGGTGTHHSTPGTIDTTTISGAADGTVPGAGAGLPDANGNGYVYATRIIPNTGRFYQEFDIIGWLALLMLSGIVAWRRSRREPEDTYR
jgi:hypothetical protein